MISVKLTTTKGQLRAMAVAAVDDMRRKAIAILSRAGELAVNEARSTIKEKDWTDRTGNLRSSVGYIICEDGKPLYESKFESVLPTAVDGPDAGRLYARGLAADTTGLALVVVAGMSYAKYVAGRGYNVLSSSQQLAAKLIPELFEKQAAYDQKNR